MNNLLKMIWVEKERGVYSEVNIEDISSRRNCMITGATFITKKSDGREYEVLKKKDALQFKKSNKQAYEGYLAWLGE